MTARQMPSTEFRVKFHQLREPVEVTVLGRVIGVWAPARVVTDDPPPKEPSEALGSTTKEMQEERDAILRRMRRAK